MKALFKGKRGRWLFYMIRALKGQSLGRLPVIERDSSLVIPFDYRSDDWNDGRIGAVVHMFYPELADEMRAHLENVPGRCDVMITTNTTEKRAHIDAVFSGWPNGEYECKIVPNRGRDILPKLSAFFDRYQDYDALLFLHTKKTKRGDLGNKWREHLLKTLAGSTGGVRSILEIFRQDSTVGVVLAQHYEPTRFGIKWFGNEKSAQALAGRLGIRINFNGYLDYPAGSMYWARPQVFAPLAKLRLTAEDFPAENDQTSETIAHAIEMTFLLICELAGYRWCKVSCAELDNGNQKAFKVAAPADLPRAIGRTHWSVAKMMLK